MFRGVIKPSKGMNSQKKKKKIKINVLSLGQRKGDTKEVNTKEMSGKYLIFFFFVLFSSLNHILKIYIYVQSFMYGISH